MMSLGRDARSIYVTCVVSIGVQSGDR